MGSDKPNGGGGTSNSQNERKHGNTIPATGGPDTNPTPSAPMPVQETQSQVAQDVGKSAENEYSDRVYRLEVWQHWFTAALVGSAILSGVIATWQGCEMKAQNKIMIWQMEQTDDLIKLTQLGQQAGIALDSYRIENVEPEQSPIVKVTIKNIGHSTATIENYGIAWINRLHASKADRLTTSFRELHASSIKLKDWQLKDVRLSPSDTFTIEEKRWTDYRDFDPKAAIQVSDAGVIEYEKEIHRFAVYVFYKDAVRDTGFSQFILRYDPESKTFTPEERGSIIE